jgi:hypothetical protein
MKNIAHLRLAAAFLAFAGMSFTGCTKDEGIEPQMISSARDRRADAGDIHDRRRNDLPTQVCDPKTTDQGALDFTPTLHGELDADDLVMLQIDKSALAGQTAYRLMISKKGIVRFIGFHDTQVPQAELRMSVQQIHQIESILEKRNDRGPFGLDEIKADQQEVCYIFSRAGGDLVKTTTAASSRQLRELEAEVFGALGLDKILLGNSFATLHD